MAEPAVAGEYVRSPGDGAPDAPTRRAERLWRLFDAAHAGTEACIVDCAERAQAKSAAVRGLRISILSLFVLGAFAPALAGQLGNRQEGAAIGYVLLALAGGLALVDQVFGVTRSWMRRRQTQARLEASLVSLRYAWAARLAKSGGAIPDAAVAADLADLIRAHLVAVEALAGAETGAWAAQLRAQLSRFDQTQTAPQGPPHAPSRA